MNTNEHKCFLTSPNFSCLFVFIRGSTNLFSHIAIFLIRAYQVALSPWIGNCCRFQPSCSNYAIEALRVHGFFKGGWLAARRLVRCRPFGPSGFDPVPPKTNTHSFP